jgi:hypothetical protein
VIDLDNTDVPLYGMQEDRFFHGYYDEHRSADSPQVAQGAHRASAPTRPLATRS